MDEILASEIILTIEGNGAQAILNQNFHPEPNSVFVNNDIRNDCKRSCNLGEYNNEIKLEFNDYVTSCENMFQGLSNLKEIDLSGFDFSKVTSMKSMFQYCTGLKSIKFGNIDTSKVENMEMTFYQCTELLSIDLSKFDTSSVTSFQFMFYQC